MNKEFLTDYEAKEIEAYEQYRKQCQSRSDITFPDLRRFSKAQTPLVIADTGFYNSEYTIWSQIPFASTLLIRLPNVSKANMPDLCGFEAYDIPKLIELSKETGRVHFALSATPIEYEGLDHLAPIFEELKPPMLQPIPLELLAEESKWEAWHDEFDAFAEAKYLSFMAKRIRDMGESQRYFNVLMNSHAFVYYRMKMLKMDDITTAMSEAMLNDPDLASPTLFRIRRS